MLTRGKYLYINSAGATKEVYSEDNPPQLYRHYYFNARYESVIYHLGIEFYLPTPTKITRMTINQYLPENQGNMFGYLMIKVSGKIKLAGVMYDIVGATKSQKSPNICIDIVNLEATTTNSRQQVLSLYLSEYELDNVEPMFK